jgi:oligopeptide transport system permease protein
MERISDILYDMPFIVVATLFQIHFSAKVGAVPCLIFAYILTGWISTASRVRTQFYRFKNQEYVMAARTLGAKDRRIIWKHIFPNTLGTIITSCALVIPGVILSESMLSFLGIVKLGSASATSLGTLLSDASGIWTNYPHLMLCPALVISLLMICFNLFSNGLRDAFNPALRGVEE